MLAWQGQLQQLTNKLVHSDRRLVVLVEPYIEPFYKLA